MLKTVAPKLAKPDQWQTGDAPAQVLEWAIDGVNKAGTVSIIGVYPETMTRFPIGKAMNKNLTIKAGNCNHRRYVPHLVELVRSGVSDPLRILTKTEPLLWAIDAYRHFARRGAGLAQARAVAASAGGAMTGT